MKGQSNETLSGQQRDHIRHHLRVILGKKDGAIADSLRALDAAAGEVPGELRHYLRKRSYAKAEIWLDGGQPPHGTC